MLWAKYVERRSRLRNGLH